MASSYVTIVLICLLLAFKLLERFLPKLLKQINWEYSEKKINLGVVSLNFLSNLSDREFDNYCLKLLKTYFKNNNQEPYSTSANLVSYIFTNDFEKKTYISIKKVTLDNEDQQNNYTIDDNYMHKFIGSLAHDTIKRGVIITNGNITPEARFLAKTVKNKYRIILIDGINLTKLCWKKGCEVV